MRTRGMRTKADEGIMRRCRGRRWSFLVWGRDVWAGFLERFHGEILAEYISLPQGAAWKLNRFLRLEQFDENMVFRFCV
jgi:hypothetical protein